MPRLPNLNSTTGFQDPFGSFIPTQQTVRNQLGYESKSKFYDEYGFLPSHNLEVKRTHWRAQPAVNKYTQRCLSRIQTYTWDSYPSWVSLYRTARDRASNRLYERLSNANALLPVMLAERQKTVDLVADKVIGVYQFYRRFRRMKKLQRPFRLLNHPTKSAAAQREISRRWLEYRYGWLPLMMEANTLLNKPLGLPRMKVVSSAIEFLNHEYGKPYGYYYETGSVSISVKCGCIAFTKNPFTKTLQQYGIGSPAVVIWELIPFSFVADWFLGVGNYLEALGATSGLDIRYAYQTTELRATIASSFAMDQPDWRPGHGNYSGELISRSLGLPKIPNPLIPSNGLNLTRAVDAIALLTQTFRRLN